MLSDVVSLEKIILIIVDIVGILFGFLVYSADRKGKINRWFFVMTILLLLWVNFAYMGDISTEAGKIVFWYKLNFGVVALCGLAAYYFCIFFLHEEKRYLVLNKLVLITSISFFYFSVFTNYIIKDITLKPSGAEIIFGEQNFLYNIFFFLLGIVILAVFFKKYFKLSSGEKLKVQYFLIGILIFISANVIFNIIFPTLLKTVNYHFLGDYASIFFLGFTAYAIVKRELFNIKIIITAVLVAVIAILLIVDIFVFTPDLLPKLYKLLILVVFIYFGWTLIRSVLKEIEWRERVDKAYEIEKKAREGLQQLDEAKNQFVMASQHHLRSPLTSMRGYVDLMMTGSYGKVPEKLKDPILKFQISTSRLIRIVNEFLDISQFQLGKKVVVTKPGVEVEPIMREIVEELQYEAQVKKLYLTFEKSTENIPLIEADREKLKVALANIIDNAIKYTRNGGITIKTQITGKKLQIIIKDTGIGMTEEERKTLFSKLFERGVEARKVFATGRGIGLFITNKIIEAHNGRIWVESEGKGKGTEFHIELPMG